MRHQCIISFCGGASETFDIANIFPSAKIALAAPKKTNLDTYRIFFNALSYRHSVKSINRDSERMGTIASKLKKIKLYSS